MELTAAEGRVLGCLIELEAAAPGAVPLTLNDLRLACNQTTGRDPVVAFDDRTVEDTLLSLKSKGLARFVAPSAEVRTTRYRQRADERWRMGPAELAVLAVLLLRGVQTLAEVRTQVQRLRPMTEPGEVDAVLDALAARTPSPFASRVGGAGTARARSAGSRPSRRRAPSGAPHGRRPIGTGPAAGLEPAGPSYAELVARVAELERRLAAAWDRPAPAPEPPPPPPPPVDVRPRPVPQLAFPDERRFTRSRPAATLDELTELVDRVVDIERRLARIEAELGCAPLRRGTPRSCPPGQAVAGRHPVAADGPDDDLERRGVVAAARLLGHADLGGRAVDAGGLVDQAAAVVHLQPEHHAGRRLQPHLERPVAQQLELVVDLDAVGVHVVGGDDVGLDDVLEGLVADVVGRGLAPVGQVAVVVGVVLDALHAVGERRRAGPGRRAGRGAGRSRGGPRPGCRRSTSGRRRRRSGPRTTPTPTTTAATAPTTASRPRPDSRGAGSVSVRGDVPSGPPTRAAALGRRAGRGSSMAVSSRRSPGGRDLGTRSTLPAAARTMSSPGSPWPYGPVAGGGEQQGGAEREHVGGGRHGLAPGLLGRHEPRRADDHAGHREPVGLVAAERHAEVGEARLAPVVEQHVGGLDVAVDDALAVRGGQRRQQADGLALDLVGRGGAVLGHPLGQAAAGEVRHDEHDLVALVDDVERPTTLGWCEPAQDVGLAQQALAGAGDLGGGALQRQALERDLAAVAGRGPGRRRPCRPARAGR